MKSIFKLACHGGVLIIVIEDVHAAIVVTYRKSSNWHKKLELMIHERENPFECQCGEKNKFRELVVGMKYNILSFLCFVGVIAMRTIKSIFDARREAFHAT